MEALELLREARVKVWVISFAGKVHAGRVFAKCDWLAQEGLVDHVTIVKEKTGPQKKVALMRRRGGVQHLFDDNWWIIEEAKQYGFDAYGINARWGHRSLKAAVQAFLLIPDAPTPPQAGLCQKDLPASPPQVFAKKTCQ